VDSKYSLGITELDSQHAEIEALFIALEESPDYKESWHARLESLCEKLRFHFYAEESIMQIFAYPETQEHKRKHLEILKSVESYKDKQLTKADIRKIAERKLPDLNTDNLEAAEKIIAGTARNMGITIEG